MRAETLPWGHCPVVSLARGWSTTMAPSLLVLALTPTTTDLDVGVSGAITAQIEKPGATTLPARRLATIVRALPAAEIIVEVDSKNVASIRCGQSFFKILGLPEEEFPPLPKLNESRASATQKFNSSART